jgi:hypothetical protein
MKLYFHSLKNNSMGGGAWWRKNQIATNINMEFENIYPASKNVASSNVNHVYLLFFKIEKIKLTLMGLWQSFTKKCPKLKFSIFWKNLNL